MQQFYCNYGKRILDILTAGMLLVLISPVLLMVALVVRLKLGAPVLFAQQRPGLNGQLFTLHKFRTMTNEKDPQGNLLSDAKRLTRFGKMLRSTSFDELPELWEVLRGRMSLVGPRPLLAQYLPLYTQSQARRHEVRPGITGLAQVNGRNNISWEERFNYDLEYLDKCSLWFDLKILVKTITCVLRREGISAKEHATCPAFKGSPSRLDNDTKLAA